MVVAFLPQLQSSESDDVSDGRADETLPLCSRLQTTEQSVRLQRPIAVADFWAYLLQQKTVGHRDVRAEYEVGVLNHFVISFGAFYRFPVVVMDCMIDVCETLCSVFFVQI